jgi:DNA-binding GntR family transcriptional regulator
VRFALRELLTEGLVELRPHGGASVTRLSLEELEELYLMRTAIESWLARLGAPRLKDDDIELMKDRLRDLERATETRDRVRYLRSGMEYRWICYAAAGRARLYTTASQLFQRSARYNFLSLEEDDQLDRSLEHARRFGERCFARNGEGAETAIREVLEWSLAYVSRGLKEALGRQ